MKPAAAFPLALFLGSMTLLAQSSGPKATQPTVLAQVVHVSTGCPIEMQALRQPGQGTQAFADRHHSGVAQQLQLTLNNRKYTEIVGLHITVHGVDAKARLFPVQTVAKDSSDIQKSIDLKLKIDPQSQTSTELFLPAFTWVSMVNLDSVNYADGSVWHSSAQHSCEIYPDGFMLISRR